MKSCVLHLLLVATACGHREQCSNEADDDGDGFSDCADQDCALECSDRGTPPWAPEDCFNGADDDRDAGIDCMDDDCRTTCDADADGYDAIEVGGQDCDDDDNDVHPGGIEVPYDGQDGDCDPATPDDDLDGDGFPIATDCADTSAATFPGAPETCGNGRVDDCDDPTAPPRSVCFGSRSLATADSVFVSTTTNNFVGGSITPIPDVDGDGDDDYVVGAIGDGSERTGAALLVLSAPGASDIGAAPVKWIGPSEEDETGTSVAYGGKLVGFGAADNLLIGAPFADDADQDSGVAYVVRTTLLDPTAPPVLVALAAPIPKVVGEAPHDQAGFSVAGPGDVDGIAVAGTFVDDAVIGAPYASGGRGAAYVVYGPILSSLSLTVTTERVVGDAVGDEAGRSVAGAGDPNGDGLADFLVGACLAGGGAGAAGLFTDHAPVERSMSEADGLFLGSGSDRAGAAVASAGDVDGDGLDDLLVGAPGSLADPGRAFLVSGPAADALLPSTAELLGTAAGDAAGAALAGAGDVNGDGSDDVVVGAPLSDAGGTDSGAAYVLFGPFAGVIDLATADAVLTGVAPYDHAGTSLGGRFDANADGFSDVVVGAPYLDGLAPSGGGAFLLTFGL